ncbi:hypothetical protein DDZ14_02825 [Maritimibacter sp. 55A14]|uniref:HNH endonuclease n=1 Tax=Maritimibacter sp. 55A14 TaxID=2174844 RepID=UPI000D615EBA|nr:HNH endonuclease [Maritimibacter sp. 55A14]PWE34106.1 hypothetical protein DDZ14_02825 [Maritimibacter sp. 55A14]
MSEILDKLAESDDEIDRDLAAVLRHWQDARAERGLKRNLGYEPRDISSDGAISVISRRVLKGSAGFEDVDPQQSYEAIVLRHSNKFEQDVVAAAELRIRNGSAAAHAFDAQEVRFLIKSTSPELFGEPGVPQTIEAWCGREAVIPTFVSDFRFGEPMIAKGFRSLIWFHEVTKDGERGNGLSAIVEFGPPDAERHATVADVHFFPHPVGNEVLEEHRNADEMIGKIRGFNHSRIWPVTQDTISLLLTAAERKTRQISELNGISDAPFDPENIVPIEETTALRGVVVRQFQAAFRNNLLSLRPHKCAITGTTEVFVLEAAHIVPYATGHPARDRPENGLLLRRDIHKLFDDGLISIDPDTRKVCVSQRLTDPDYMALRDILVEDKVSKTCLQFHYDHFWG